MAEVREGGGGVTLQKFFLSPFGKGVYSRRKELGSIFLFVKGYTRF